MKSLILALLLIPDTLFSQRLIQMEALKFLCGVARSTDRIMPVAATGSMYPFLDENCLTLVRRIPVEKIQTGDIIVYEQDGTLVGHRVVRRCRGLSVITQGDHNPQVDFPVKAASIRGVVVAMAAFDPDSPKVPSALIGFEATNLELKRLPIENPFTLSQAQETVRKLLTPDKWIVTVQTTQDSKRRSEQSVLVVRKATGNIRPGDLVTLNLSSLSRLFRAFRRQKDTTARRVESITDTVAVVHKEGYSNECVTVSRKSLQGLVVGCVFFAERDTNPGECIYLE
jgi:signal peptidase I